MSKAKLFPLAGKAPAPLAGNAVTGFAPEPPPPEQCGGCKFFRAAGEGVAGEGAVGRCRRYPPGAGVLKTLSGGPLTAFPLVDYDSWCGEFVRRA